MNGLKANGFAPKKIGAFLKKLLPYSYGICILLLGIGFGKVFFDLPGEKYQGDIFKILYIHVPSAWLGLAMYLFSGAMSLGFLVWRVPFCFFAARSSAKVGFVFTAICLITGAIWGKQTWGAYWVWDARLTSMLILLFLYGGYLLLSKGPMAVLEGARGASFLIIMGCLNLPIIKFSVEWWASLHQKSSISFGAIHMPFEIFWPLVATFGGFLAYAFICGLYFYLSEIEVVRKYVKTEMEIK